MASIEIVEIGDTYIDAKLTGLSTEYNGTARTAYWTLSSDGGKTFTTYATSGLEMQDVNGQVIRLEEVEAYLKGLNPNTEYVFTVVVYNRDTNTPSSGNPLSTIEYKNSEGKNLIKTKSAGSSGESGGDSSETSDFLTVEYNANSRRITMTVNFDIKFPIGSCTFYIKKPDGKTTNIDGNSSTNRVTVEYTADSAGTYIIQAVVWTNGEAAGSSYKYDDDWGGYPSDEIKITIEANRPPNFNWEDEDGVNPFVCGEPAVTINKQGDEITVSFNHRTKWNAFVKRVSEFLEYTGCYNGPDADTYQSYIDDAIVRNGKNLTAEQFNGIRFCIGSMNTFNQSKYRNNAIYKHHTSTGRWDMEAGEKMKAEYFTALAEVLNDIE